MTDLFVDTHAHVFHRGLPMVEGRRYTPDYDATYADYVAELDRAGVGHGVLVQPSFLGYDNSYLIDCLERSQGRMRGIAVVRPDTGSQELDRLQSVGVVGIRFNLVGEDPARLTTAGHQGLIREASARAWQIEVQSEGPNLPMVLDALSIVETPVVVDHFGKPDPKTGLDCPGFRRLLAAGPQGNVFVKLSAPYRLGVRHFAVYAEWLFRFLGPGRLVWGSDWPWTQNELGRVYVAEREVVRSLCRSDTAWLALHRTAARLFGFA